MVEFCFDKAEVIGSNPIRPKKTTLIILRNLNAHSGCLGS